MRHLQNNLMLLQNHMEINCSSENTFFIEVDDVVANEQAATVDELDKSLRAYRFYRKK